VDDVAGLHADKKQAQAQSGTSSSGSVEGVCQNDIKKMTVSMRETYFVDDILTSQPAASLCLSVPAFYYDPQRVTKKVSKKNYNLKYI